MFFSRSCKYQSHLPLTDIKGKLIGKHIEIRQLDFEVIEREDKIKVIPHAEQETAIKTLPITHVLLNSNGKGTNIIVHSKMRKIDLGGPLLIVIFCSFLLVAGILTYILGGSAYINYTYILIGISLGIFLIFWFRLETGYFDYIRKIRRFVQQQVQ